MNHSEGNLNSPKNKAIKIIKILKKKGFVAFLVGGAVRDILMGVEPKDFDIATNALPEQIEKIFNITSSVGRQFGIVIVGMDGEKFEVATFRKDSIESDGRHPDKVSFSTMEEDAQRRDLTINAIFFDPIKNQLIDFVNGKDDIEKGIIRFVGEADERINEDKLRMLRAIRFAIRLGFEIEHSSFEAIKKHASEIDIISPERINQEFTKMLECRKPSMMFDLLDSSNLMTHIFPEIKKLIGLEQDPEWHPEGATVRKITYLE